MTTFASAPPASRIAHPSAQAARRALRLGAAPLALTALWLLGAPAQARPSYDGSAPTCFLTAGGTLEICRDGSEAEGVLAAPSPCTFVRGVQLRRPRTGATGPIEAVFQGESPLAKTRRGEDCPERRATDMRDGGALHTGRSPEQLATILPPSEIRFGGALPERREPKRRRGEAPAEPTVEGIGPRDPIAVSGRDWAGEEYSYVFLLGQEVVGADVETADETPRRRRGRGRREADAPPADMSLRRVQIEARTLDFAHFEIRTRAENGYGLAWVPVSGEGRRRTAPVPAAVLDETGRPVASACPAPPSKTRGLAGSISIVDHTYHYFYTDVLPEDCALPPEKRRTGLFLRTATDLAAEKVWSSPRRLGPALPPDSLVRVARAKGTKGWAVSYTCYRPANAPGGPVADICLQYTADLDPAAIGALTLYADPVEAGRSTAYLGLRSGGNGAGRFDRSAHFWMTDAYGNLDVPATYAGKSGLLTWVDRLAPGAGGYEGSQVYGRPVYWSTWTARRTTPP
ncbi:hypothetical protein [Methylobacterium sp. J-076]|uniref:hypothetical protein n=1 Tax=Methylobacterium sp. J-076 TaxID=2836655 RepID=UPI001FBA18B4|nr:hypothetical protein [Methylobacterium sp. J-076]MCJ2015776.1 hypothetical protein [Methylobacterium sp. J-076]